MAQASPAPWYDVIIIIGGGVSGVYCGWRLLTAEPRPGTELHRLATARPNGKPSVCLFESSDGIGGRLYSVAHPAAPHLYAELGGMRFLGRHESVFGLAKHLGLQTEPFNMGGKENRQYLRHVNFTLEDFRNHPRRYPTTRPGWKARSTQLNAC